MGQGLRPDAADGSIARSRRPAVCDVHGLAYDTAMHGGCVLCRRKALGSPTPRRSVWVGAGIALAVAGIGASVWALADSNRRIVAMTTAPPAATSGGGALGSSSARATPLRAPDPLQRAVQGQDPNRSTSASRGFSMAGGPAGAMPPGGCEVPFFDGSDPSTWLAEGRRRCDGGDGDACTALGFVCDRQTWIHYPHGALPTAVLDSAACTALLNAGRQTGGACKHTDSPYNEQFFDLGCKTGNHLACRQPEVTQFQRQDPHFAASAEDDCLHGDPTACSDLATHYFQRHQDGVSHSYSNMAKELVACRLDGRPACSVSSDSLRAAAAAKTAAARTPEQVESDRLAELTRRCDAHDEDACDGLAQVYLKGPTKDLRRLAALAQRDCAAGSAPACLGLSQMRARGEGLPPDETLALEATERARQLGTQACLRGDGGLSACLAALFANSPEWLQVPPAPARDE